MSTTIGEVNINLRMSLAQFRQDTQQGMGEASRASKGMADAVGHSSHEAKASLALISEEIGVKIPRHIRGFIADIPGVGTALTAAFSSVAIIALIEVVVKIVEKIREFKKAQEEAAAAGEKVRESMNKLDIEGRAAIEDLHAKFVGLTQGPLAEMEYKLQHVSEQLQALKLGDELNKSFADIEKSLKGSFFEFGSGSGLDKFQEFKKSFNEVLTTQGRPAALESIIDELIKVNKEIDYTKANVGGQIGNNTVVALQKYVTALSAMEQTVEHNLSISAEKRRNEEQAVQNERVKEAEKAAKEVMTARKAEYDELKALEREASGLLDKHVSAQDKEIEKLNEAVQKWTEYKLTWEEANNGISTVANSNIERLQKEINLLQAQADQAIDSALKAVALADQTKNPLTSFKDATPLYGGTKEAMDLAKIQTEQTAALKEAEKVYTATRTSAEQYAQEMAILNELLRQGKIDQETYDRAAAQASERANQLSKEAHILGKDIGNTLSQAALFGRSWSDAFRSIAIQMTELILKMTLFKHLTATSSGGGGFFSSLLSGFGGMKAEGGPLDSGKWYIAGEHGPEPVWGGGSGAFAAGYPGASAKAETAQNIQHTEFHFHGVTDADSFRKSSSQIAGDMLAVMSRAARRNS